eukprot:481642-Pelagomonas_calceolata.AAC.3
MPHGTAHLFEQLEEAPWGCANASCAKALCVLGQPSRRRSSTRLAKAGAPQSTACRSSVTPSAQCLPIICGTAAAWALARAADGEEEWGRPAAATGDAEEGVPAPVEWCKELVQRGRLEVVDVPYSYHSADRKAGCPPVRGSIGDVDVTDVDVTKRCGGDDSGGTDGDIHASRSRLCRMQRQD